MTAEVEVTEFVLPTNVSVMDTGYNYTSQPVMGVFALYQEPAVPPAIALGTVDPEPAAEDDEEAKAAKAEAESKVISNPGKGAAAKAAAASEAVVTK